jgi:hypothetical protein
MPDDDDDKKDGIYKVDTVPPPPGEGDAYSAPTKVGPMAAAVVEEMMHAAERKAAALLQRAEEQKASVRERTSTQPAPPLGPASRPAGARAQPGLPGRKPDPAPSPSTLDAAELVELDDGPPPRLYDDSDDEDNAATLLSKAAQAPVVMPIPRPARVPALDLPVPASKPAAAFPPTPAPTAAFPPTPSATSPQVPHAAPRDARKATPAMGFPPLVPTRAPGPPAPIPFALHAEPRSESLPPPFGPPGASGPFAPSNGGLTFLERPVAVYGALVIGFTLFFVGIALYLWAR